MKTITAKTAGTIAISGAVLAMSLLAGCGNKGPLIKPSDIPPPVPAVPAQEAPAPDAPAAAAPAPEAAPAPATPPAGAG